MKTITVRCNCPVCLLANVFGFASDCTDCGYCVDGVFDREKYEADTEDE